MRSDLGFSLPHTFFGECAYPAQVTKFFSITGASTTDALRYVEVPTIPQPPLCWVVLLDGGTANSTPLVQPPFEEKKHIVSFSSSFVFWAWLSANPNSCR